MRPAEASPDRSGDRPRGPASPARIWPRPVEQEDLEHLRRRHRSLQERRRSRWWRLARVLLWTATVVGGPVLAVLWLFTSPRFALRELTIVTGGSLPAAGETSPAALRVTEAWVRETLEPFVGTHLLRLSLDDVARELERHPWVKSTSISKDLPERLSVRIVEHREAALWRDGDELYYLDGNGYRIAPVPAVPRPDGSSEVPDGAPRQASIRDLPVLYATASGSEVDPAAGLELLRELQEVRPDWIGGGPEGRPLEVEVLGQDDFKLWIAELPFPLLVKAGALEDKLRRWEQLLPEVSGRYGAGAAVDLRFDRRIIIQPSAGGVPPGQAPPHGPAGAAPGRNS